MSIPTAVQHEAVPSAGWNAMKAAVEAAPSFWGAAAVVGSYSRPSSSVTYTDVDATNMAVTFTAKATECYLLVGASKLSVAAYPPLELYLGYDLDGAADVQIAYYNEYGANYETRYPVLNACRIGSLVVDTEYVLKLTWAGGGQTLYMVDPWMLVFGGAA
jgi:hypothetical protein